MPTRTKAVTSGQPDVIDELLDDWQRQRPDLDVAAMAVVGRVIHLGNLAEADANRVLRPYRLRYTDFDVLATLRRQGEPFELNPTRLRRSILVTSGAMTACLTRLEKSGLVKRLRDPNDRRGSIVRLTRKGFTIIDKAIVPRFEVAAEMVSGLSKAEAKTLARLLEKLTPSQHQG